MIIKASERGGANALATYLLAYSHNDHVELHNLRGFASDNLRDALLEVEAVSQATKCTNFMLSVSLNPPPGVYLTAAEFEEAAGRVERGLGLEGQPRAIVFHEKKGRRHAHVVWSKIDADQMKAINLPFFKTKLNQISKELFLDHGWVLPDGYKSEWKNPLDLTLAEWEQAERQGLDPREIKQLFREAWERSDSRQSFAAALEEHGYYLARGDRRGFVAVGLGGDVHAIARYAGIKTKDVNARLGNPRNLPSVDEVKSHNRQRFELRLKSQIDEARAHQANELAPLQRERERLLQHQRKERKHLKERQSKRWAKETRQRAERMRKGWRGAVDLLTGRARQIRKQNEAETHKAWLRDRSEREALFAEQFELRSDVTKRVEALKHRHRRQRMTHIRNVALVLKLKDRTAQNADRSRRPRGPRGPEFSL